MKFEVLVCEEVWGTVVVEAANESEAVQKVEEDDYESDFKPNGYTGNRSVYRATMMMEEEQA